KAGSKRKRTAKQAQPLKGGWVLPHGMGIGFANATTSSDHEPSASQGGTAPNSALTGVSQPGEKNTIPTQKKQTRITLRVTKPGVKVQMGGQQLQDPAVKLEEPIGESGGLIIQTTERPVKRARTSSSAHEADNLTTTKGPLERVQVKEEEAEVIKRQVLRKLVIIKGITLKDNAIVKTLDKIIIDATQLLDPNYRIMVKRGKENPYGLTPGYSPYPYRRVPTPEACEEVHRILTEMHGEVKQPDKIPVASLEVAGCGEVPCVLDALLRTLISGNTLMALADAAIKNLAQHYGTRQGGTGAGSIDWDKVRLSSHQELVQVIRAAGNGPKKAQHIKQILDMVYEENLKKAKEQTAAAGVDSTGTADQDLLSLDYMHGLSKDEAMAKFVSYPGIGIKTAACVTLFCLRMPCFAVDTHVHKFCRWLAWIPERADPDNCFRHGEVMVPDHLKYGLHQLFIRHGQQCFKCRKATKPGTKDWNEAPQCPLEHLLDRSKDEAASGPKPKKKQVQEDEDSEED
ncbi:DNA glycosylase, partial [Canariomyces notabilis]